jgi:hypothetical protein
MISAQERELKVTVREVKRLAFGDCFRKLRGMGLPAEPVTLTVEQIGQLNRQLSNMRHDINNNLSLMMAALELIRYKPEMTGQMIGTLTEQFPKITEALNRFSAEFEKRFGITRS